MPTLTEIELSSGPRRISPDIYLLYIGLICLIKFSSSIVVIIIVGLIYGKSSFILFQIYIPVNMIHFDYTVDN